MCTVCATFNPYLNTCEYDGLPVDDDDIVSPEGSVTDGPDTNGFTEAEWQAHLETVLQANDFSYDSWNPSGTEPLTLTYSFESGPASDFPWDNVGGGFGAYTAAEQAAVRAALEEFERVINVEFVEVAAGGDAEIAFYQAGDLNTDVDAVYGGRGRWRYSGSDWDGSVLFNTARDLTDPGNFDLILHEIGHALGLRHPGDYDIGGGGPPGPYLDPSLDSDQYSIMSYFTNDTNAESRELMMFDIAALQLWWGANLDYATGDDVYTATGEGRFHVIWDAGGNDSISHTSGTARIDLREGAFSTLSGVTELVVGRDVVIEEARSGGGHDTLLGNAASNLLASGGGNDRVSGFAGSDTIRSGSGDDTVAGGQGRDRAFLGDGADRYSDTSQGGVSGRDTVYGGSGGDHIHTGGGNDRLIGGSGYDTLVAGTGNDYVSGGSGNDRMSGNSGNDRMIGGTGNDRMYGSTGRDTLSGSAGNDYMNGGSGNDRMNGGHGNDRLIGGRGADDFIFKGNFGDDTIKGFSTASGREDIDLSGVSAIRNYTDLVNNHMSQSGNHVLIDDNRGNTITVLNTDLGDLDRSDFLF